MNIKPESEQGKNGGGHRQGTGHQLKNKPTKKPPEDFKK